LDAIYQNVVQNMLIHGFLLMEF